MRPRCRGLLFMKLKKKSSNNSSAAFGIGVSSTIIATVSESFIVSATKESVETESTCSGFLSVHPVLKEIIATHRMTTTITPFFMSICVYVYCIIPSTLNNTDAKVQYYFHKQQSFFLFFFIITSI